jgi:hypothetical protein
MSPRLGLDDVKREMFSPLPGLETFAVRPIASAIPTTLTPKIIVSNTDNKP